MLNYCKLILIFIMVFYTVRINAQCNCNAALPINQGLVACYPFNGNANDQTSNANNGIVSGATQTTDRFGNANSAYYFDGIDDGIDIARSPSLEPLNTVSVAAWVYKNPGGQFWTPIISKRYALSDPYNSYSMDGGSGITQRWMVNICKGTVGSQTSVYTTNSRQFNVWDFLVMVYDGATLKMYLNGELEASIPLTGNIGYSTLGLFIGKNSVSNQFFKGKIDDVRIYNRPLSSCDVKHLYNNCSGNNTYHASNLIIPSTISVCQNNAFQVSANFSGMSYSWSPAIFFDSATIMKPRAIVAKDTTLYLSATDGFCTYTDSVLIDVSNFVFFVKRQETICSGDSVKLNVSGASSYKWKYDLSLSDSTISNPYAKPLTTRKYFVTGQYNGCEAIDSVIVNIVNNLFVDAGKDTSICYGDTIKLSAIGGSVFRWSPRIAINDTSLSSPLVWPSKSQYYYLYATSGSCYGYDSVLVSINQLPLLSAVDTIVCGTKQTFAITVNGSDSNIYKWNPGTYLSDPNIKTPIITPLKSIDYIIEAQNATTKCKSIDTVNVFISNPVSSFTVSDSIVLVPGSVKLNNTSTPMSLIFSWFLNDTFYSSYRDIDLTINRIGLHRVRLIVTDTMGCVDSIEVIVNGKQLQNVFIPNVFTPNGDGLNDLFVIDVDVDLFEEFSGSIWNRWGGKIDEFDGKIGNWWNGYYEEKQCPEGVYFYLIRTKTVRGLVKEYKGTITLIR